MKGRTGLTADIINLAHTESMHTCTVVREAGKKENTQLFASFLLLNQTFINDHLLHVISVI